jgi:hypothetical protein
MRALLLSFFVLTSTFALSQEQPKVALVDEFGKIHCDDMLARVDNFFIQLHNYKRNATGHFVIRSSQREIASQVGMEQLLRTAIVQRRYDPSLVTITRSQWAEPLKVEMYLLQHGAPVSELRLRSADLRLPSDAEPFLISTEFYGICDAAPLEPISRDLLESNREGQIYAVINGRTTQERRNKLKEAIVVLSGFPRSRVRYLLRISDHVSNDYWFVNGRATKKWFFDWLNRTQPDGD